MASEFHHRSYSREEAADLIEMAARLQRLTDERKEELREGLTYADVVSIAREFGVSEDELVHAMDERRRGMPPPTVAAVREKARGTKRRFSDRVWRAHLIWYASTVVGVTGIDLFEGGGIDFAGYPAFGWGIFVLAHTLLRALAKREQTA